MTKLELQAVKKALQLIEEANEPVSLGLYRPNDSDITAALAKQRKLLCEALEWLDALE